MIPFAGRFQRHRGPFHPAEARPGAALAELFGAHAVGQEVSDASPPLGVVAGGCIEVVDPGLLRYTGADAVSGEGVDGGGSLGTERGGQGVGEPRAWGGTGGRGDGGQLEGCGAGHGGRDPGDPGAPFGVLKDVPAGPQWEDGADDDVLLSGGAVLLGWRAG